MSRLSLQANLDTYTALVNAYSEKHRYYHTIKHIDHCLGLIVDYREVAKHADEVELAIWFHDAIYDPLSKDNEAKSARWADRFLLDNKCSQTVVDRIHRMIMATVHDSPATDRDVQLLVDIDLSILGSNTEVYGKFEKNVRREYKWVPGPLFRRERRNILQSFLDRDAIYSIDLLRDRYEAQARANLAAAIDSLSKGNSPEPKNTPKRD